MKHQFIKPIILLFLTLTTAINAQQNCIQSTFKNNKVYSLCNSLPKLGASIHWTYHPSDGTADIAYRAPQSASGWVAWALNPQSLSMAGSQALIAFPASNGALTVYTVSLQSTSPIIQNESLSFPVYSRDAEYLNGVMTIYASIGVPKNRTTVNQVWQAGTSFANGLPSAHPFTGDNVQSMGTLDLLSGNAAQAGGNSRLHRRNTHGILNAISWGILLPIGAITARYLKVFKAADPAWFYLHASCQTAGYAVGVAGWGTGLKLGSESSGITYQPHRNIGIALFCLGTLQVFALLLRPNKDNKYRIYWNVYHHLTGYTVIILSVVNVFKGFDILKPEQGWKTAFIAIISTLGGIAVFLEAVTWTIVLKRKSTSNENKAQNGNGNGYTNPSV